MTNDVFTPDATAEVDVEEALAGALAKGISVGVGQAKGQTGAVTTDFSETGHAQLSDTNVQELQSFASGLVTISAATLKAGLDNVALSRQINAASLDNLATLSNQLVQDFGNKAMHRHSEIAADRQWNINETDFYATVAAAVAAAMAEKSFEN